jgi:3-deoxy-manno-octulosonate cytidylyltransferase (CMP-KDO synthetase)
MTLGIIPARYASTRFPEKPLIDIQGKTMIECVYEQAKKVKSFSRLIIATDHEIIFNHVKNFGGEVMMTSPHHNSGTERCGEVVRNVKKEYDIVVNIQGDEPFIQPQQLELLISAFKKPETQVATLCIKMNNEDAFNPNVVKVVFDKYNSALYFSRNAIPYLTRMVGENLDLGNKDYQHSYFKHIGIYAYRSNVLREIVQLQQTPLEKAETLEQLRWLENGYKISVVETDIETMSIDTPEDLKKIIVVSRES